MIISTDRNLLQFLSVLPITLNPNFLSPFIAHSELFLKPLSNGCLVDMQEHYMSDQGDRSLIREKRSITPDL